MTPREKQIKDCDNIDLQIKKQEIKILKEQNKLLDLQIAKFIRGNLKGDNRNDKKI